MKFILFFVQLVFCLFLTLLLVVPIFLLFKPVFIATSFVIPYAIYPFDICIKAPFVWKYIKLTYCVTCIYVCFTFSNSIFVRFLKKRFFLNLKKKNKRKVDLSGIHLYLGKSDDNSKIYLTEKGLFQNILVTGTIGTGKTSSGMYPFAKQLISYNSDSNYENLGMLILDVKGNFYKHVKIFAEEAHRLDDLCVIEVSGSIKYNPLDKPDLKPSVLANRLKTILTLFSPNNSESYWLDKAEQVLTEAIKLCRLYNDNYVTFTELHKLINSPNYYNEKISLLRNLFKSRVF